MSEIKAGDKIYFQGNQGKVMRVISDENEPLLEVVLTQKRVAYLNPSQLDLYPFAEKLNENQQIVLEWLKEEQTKNPELSIFGTLSVLFDESENQFMNLDVIDALNNLSNPQQEGVFQAFSKWSLEQGEE
ncbi:hypothetical protein [Enterococcus gallinarum]|uniref:hypothetical protein n=1 Tax=Enterococcus gallinarum TaxID=1353 RepID=UPI0011C7FBE9|nr:hypothetical protein [Enterococcus gallinarum]